MWGGRREVGSSLRTGAAAWVGSPSSVVQWVALHGPLQGLLGQLQFGSRVWPWSGGLMGAIKSLCMGTVGRQGSASPRGGGVKGAAGERWEGKGFRGKAYALN